MQYLTYHDSIQHLIDYLGGTPSDVVVRDCKRAVQAAFLDLVNAHNWSYLYRMGRINTVAPASAGTVSYDHTGGTYERQLTLDGATWPSWADRGYIRIGLANYQVDEVKSSTVVTLQRVFNPEADLADSAYTCYQDSYLLPEGVIAQDQALYSSNFCGMAYTHIREWAYESRYAFASGTPQFYTITGDDRLPGRLCFRCFPYPGEAKTIDFVYKRRPTQPSLELYSGLGTVAADVTTATLTTGSFATVPAESVVRFSRSASAPTSWVDRNPPAFESVIEEVLTDTTARMLESPTEAWTAVAVTASSLIDIEPGAMRNAFLRGCEKQIAQTRTLKDKPSAARQYDDAMLAAKDADSRSFARRSEGGTGRYRQRMRDMPSGPDQP